MELLADLSEARKFSCHQRSFACWSLFSLSDRSRGRSVSRKLHMFAKVAVQSMSHLVRCASDFESIATKHVTGRDTLGYLGEGPR